MRSLEVAPSTWEAITELETAHAEVGSAQLRLLRAIAACGDARTWIEDDCRDLSHRVALRLGISLWRARRLVACARALEELPLVAHALSDGELSLDKTVELTRLATPRDERRLLAWVKRVSVATISDRADYETRIGDHDLKAAETQRSVKWWLTQDDRVALYGLFPTDAGIKVTKAIDRLAAKMPLSPEDPGHPEALIEARRADALVALASSSLGADADADRATVVVHAELDALVSGDRNAVVAGGSPIHPAVAERLLCDCRYQPVLHGENGLVIGIGMTSRLIPLWLRRQVEHRDHFRCTFPNCGSRAFTDCHHVVPWRKGPTDIDNLTLLCSTHHKLVHEHRWRVELAPDQSTRWFRPGGIPYDPRPGPRPRKRTV